MGLTKASTGNSILNSEFEKANCDYTIAIARKS